MKNKKTLLVFFLIISSFTLVHYFISAPKKAMKAKRIKVIKPNLNKRLNTVSVRNELIKNGCIEIELSLKLLRLESANFTSRFATDYNNISGMKLQPFETHHIGIDSDLNLIYSDWRDCIKDFATWQSYALSKNSGIIPDWCLYYEKHYCGSRGYCDAIKKL